MRVLFVAAACLASVALSLSTTYSGLLQFVDDCSSNYLSVCKTSYTSIRYANPIRSLSCLNANYSSLTGSCATDVFQHPFATCAADATTLCKDLVDPGDNGESDSFWVTSFYPFRKGVECLVKNIQSVSSDTCANKIKNTGFYTCLNDINTYCNGTQITTAAQRLSCLNNKRTNIQSLDCSKAVDNYIPQNWDNLNSGEIQYYSQLFYGVPYGGMTDYEYKAPTEERKLTPLGVFFVFAFLIFSIAASIYAKKR
eukprot:TRINITY_DN725_c0_g1_i1.p1 TRINITY_DN725_c0_g1~~TRINITY_DN725_c0_g1_i1.p1  ORF type:complete len:254 (+),score=66.36 TRINITY_DN725_c0_g1_i1:71-832(+)